MFVLRFLFLFFWVLRSGISRIPRFRQKWRHRFLGKVDLWKRLGQASYGHKVLGRPACNYERLENPLSAGKGVVSYCHGPLCVGGMSIAILYMHALSLTKSGWKWSYWKLLVVFSAIFHPICKNDEKNVVNDSESSPIEVEVNRREVVFLSFLRWDWSACGGQWHGEVLHEVP